MSPENVSGDGERNIINMIPSKLLLHSAIVACLLFVLMLSCVERRMTPAGINNDTLLVTQELDTLNKRTSNVVSNSPLSTYRYRAFDKIEFGTHDDYTRDTFRLLNEYFTYSGQLDDYYGLSWFRLNQIEGYPSSNSAVQQLEEISKLISLKYGQGKLKNSLKLESGFLRSLPIIGSNVDPSSSPEDNGADLTYKQWISNEIQISIGYIISYLDNNIPRYIRIMQKPKYIIYIGFQSTYLEQLIQGRIDSERKVGKDKDAAKF